MLSISVLPYIPIYIIEFILLIRSKVTSCLGLVTSATVIDPKLEGLDTYQRIDREWNIAWLE